MAKVVAKWWTPRNGKPLLIADMSDQHILNTIRYLIRRAEREMARLELSAMVYAMDAPDGAALCVEQGLAELEEMGAGDRAMMSPMFRELVREAERRGLDK